MSETEGKKRKRKFNYTLMLFIDSKDGRIKQMGIGPTVIESLAIIGLAVVVILAIICYREGEKIDSLEARNDTRRRQ